MHNTSFFPFISLLVVLLYDWFMIRIPGILKLCEQEQMIFKKKHWYILVTKNECFRLGKYSRLHCRLSPRYLSRTDNNPNIILHLKSMEIHVLLCCKLATSIYKRPPVQLKSLSY